MSLAEWWTAVFTYHQASIKPDVAMMFAKDIFEYSQQELDRAWGAWRSTNRRAPVPSDIIGLINPPYTIDEVTNIVVDAIWTALFWRNWNGDSRDYVYEWLGDSWSGDAAREVIEASGGWNRLWLTAGKEKATFFKKELREMAKPRVANISRDNPGLYLKRPKPSQELRLLDNHAPGEKDE